MKYLIPEAVLILGGIFFTKPYVELSVFLFKFLYQTTSLEIFSKKFLAFPFVIMLVFIFIGWLRQLTFKAGEDQIPIYDLRYFLKIHSISFLILGAFLVRTFEAIGEVDSISPFWISQFGSIDILLNMVGLFCISSVIVHLCFSIKSFLKILGCQNASISSANTKTSS